MLEMLLALYLLIGSGFAVGAYRSARAAKNLPGWILWALPALCVISWPAVSVIPFSERMAAQLLQDRRAAPPKKQTSAPSSIRPVTSHSTVADIPALAGMPVSTGKQITTKKRAKIVTEWFLYFGSNCPLCGQVMGKVGKARPTKATIDHILARALGGTHAPDNLRVICQRCNMSKGQSEAKQAAARQAQKAQPGAPPVIDAASPEEPAHTNPA